MPAESLSSGWAAMSESEKSAASERLLAGAVDGDDAVAAALVEADVRERRLEHAVLQHEHHLRIVHVHAAVGEASERKLGVGVDDVESAEVEGVAAPAFALREAFDLGARLDEQIVDGVRLRGIRSLPRRLFARRGLGLDARARVALIGVEVEIGDLQIGHDMRTLAGGDDADGAGRGGTVERQLGIGEAPRLAARPQVPGEGRCPETRRPRQPRAEPLGQRAERGRVAAEAAFGGDVILERYGAVEVHVQRAPCDVERELRRALVHDIPERRDLGVERDLLALRQEAALGVDGARQRRRLDVGIDRGDVLRGAVAIVAVVRGAVDDADVAER